MTPPNRYDLAATLNHVIANSERSVGYAVKRAKISYETFRNWRSGMGLTRLEAYIRLISAFGYELTIRKKRRP